MGFVFCICGPRSIFPLRCVSRLAKGNNGRTGHHRAIGIGEKTIRCPFLPVGIVLGLQVLFVKTNFMVNVAAVVITTVVGRNHYGGLDPASKVCNSWIFGLANHLVVTVAVSVALGRGRVAKVVRVVATAGLVISAIGCVERVRHHAAAGGPHRAISDVAVDGRHHGFGSRDNGGNHGLGPRRNAHAVSSLEIRIAAFSFTNGCFGHGVDARVHARVVRGHAHIGNARGTSGWIVGIGSTSLLDLIEGARGTCDARFRVVKAQVLLGSLVNREESFEGLLELCPIAGSPASQAESIRTGVEEAPTVVLGETTTSPQMAGFKTGHQCHKILHGGTNRCQRNRARGNLSFHKKDVADRKLGKVH
mmetsp:Transcript_12471/g.35421  ORF Transcript_12471/g.35421 Transcript_12471/m.35421 type:complete len:362 (-) Transcript_12471:1507-2592(-)